MEEYLLQFQQWVISLGERHDVDPLTLGCLYLVSKPCFVTCLVWVVRRVRAKHNITIPLLLASLSFSIPYMYVIIMGRNISVWIYVFIACMFIYGGYTIWKKITEKPVVEESAYTEL